MHFYIYIVASRSRVLYTGVTHDLRRRIFEHRHHLIPGFTARYNVDRLVYFETTYSARAAYDREYQIKGWSRSKKIKLIELENAGWLDLARDWFPVEE